MGDPNELLPIVDDQDKVIGKTTRREAHKNGFRHREVFVFVINNKRLVLQKRRDNKRWDWSVGGHVPYGSTYEDSAVRETHEELGITTSKEELKYIGTEPLVSHWKTGEVNKRIGKFFVLYTDQEELTVEQEAILEAKYFSKKELEELFEIPNSTCTQVQPIIKQYIFPLL